MCSSLLTQTYSSGALCKLYAFTKLGYSYHNAGNDGHPIVSSISNFSLWQFLRALPNQPLHSYPVILSLRITNIHHRAISLSTVPGMPTYLLCNPTSYGIATPPADFPSSTTTTPLQVQGVFLQTLPTLRF